MLKQQYLSSQKGPIGKGISLPRPLNAPPFQDKGAMNNPDDLLQQMLIDKTYDPNTIQGVIQRVGKGNFFSDKNQLLDGINVEYNWSTDDKKQYKSLTTFSDINYDEHQGCFPIIREMLQVVLTEKQFKKVKYSKIKKQIILPKDAFEKDNGTNYDPIKGFHNVDSYYKYYIYKVLEDISNQHGLFSKPLSQKELIFFAIERIKADYQAARFYFKELYNIDDELIKYSKLKGHYIDDDSSTGMKFQNHTYINLEPLFNQGGKPIKSVHVKNGNDWLKVYLNSDYDLSQEQLDKLTNLTEVYVKGGEPLNKHTYKDDCEITNHQLDIYRNAAMLAALDGRYFPSQDENQDKYYLTHAHWFTLFKINNKKLLDYVEKEPYAAQHSFNNDDYNPYQIEQITINNNEQQTCRKLTPNKKTKIADDDEIIKRLLNLGFAGIPLNANVDFDEYYCSPKLIDFYNQMANNNALPWKAGAQNYPLEPQFIMYVLIRTALREGFNLNKTIRHFAQHFDTYKQGRQLPTTANDVIGDKICQAIDNDALDIMQVRMQNQNLNPQNIIPVQGGNVGRNDNATDGEQNNNNDGTQPRVAGTVPTTTTVPRPAGGERQRAVAGEQGPQPVQAPPAVPPPAATEIVLLAGEDESQDIFVQIDGNGNARVTRRPSIGTHYKTVLPPNYLYRFFEKLSEPNQPGREPTKCKEDLLHMIDCILNSKDVGVNDEIDNAKVQLLAKKILENINNPIPNNLTYRALFTALKKFLDDPQSPANKTFEITTELSNIGGDYVAPNGRLRLRSDEDNPQEIVSSFAYTFSSDAKIKLVYHDQSKNKCLVQIDETYFITETTTTTDLSTNRPLTFIKLLVDDGQILEAREIDITNARPFQEVAQLNIEGGKIKVQEINPVPVQVQTRNIIENSGSLRTSNNVNTTSNLFGNSTTGLNNITNIQNQPIVVPKKYVLLVFDDQNEQVVSIDSNGNIEEVGQKVGNEPGNISLDSIRFTVLSPNYLYLFFEKLSYLNKTVENLGKYKNDLLRMIDYILHSNLPLDRVTIGGNARQLIVSILQVIQENINVDGLTYGKFFEKLQEFLRKQELDLTNINFSNIKEKLKSVDNYLISKNEKLFLELNAEDPLKINSSFCWTFRQNSIIKLLYHDQEKNKCLVQINNIYFIANTAKKGTQTVIKFSVNDGQHLQQQEIDITGINPPREVAQLNIEGGKIKINQAQVRNTNTVSTSINNLGNNASNLENMNNANNTGLNNNKFGDPTGLQNPIYGIASSFGVQTNLNSAMQNNTDNKINVIVRLAGNNQLEPIQIKIGKSATVEQLKNEMKTQLQKWPNIDLSNVNFVYNDNTIQDNKRLDELGISDNANVFVVLKKKAQAIQQKGDNSITNRIKEVKTGLNANLPNIGTGLNGNTGITAVSQPPVDAVVDLTGFTLLAKGNDGYFTVSNDKKGKMYVTEVFIKVFPSFKSAQLEGYNPDVNHLSIDTERISWGKNQNVQKVKLKIGEQALGMVEIKDGKGTIDGEVLQNWLSLCKQQQINNNQINVEMGGSNLGNANNDTNIQK